MELGYDRKAVAETSASKNTGDPGSASGAAVAASEGSGAVSTAAVSGWSTANVSAIVTGDTNLEASVTAESNIAPEVSAYSYGQDRMTRSPSAFENDARPLAIRRITPPRRL